MGIFRGAPVYYVSWNDIMGNEGFCAKLNAQEKAAGRLPDGYAYTLPTEAQWEYACRAGTTAALNNGKNLTSIESCPNMDEVGWYWYNWGQENTATHVVGQKGPNAWGLYDTHGNVWEWCKDNCNYSNGIVTDTYVDGIKDPLCTTGPYRVVRGGSWSYDAVFCRSAGRSAVSPEINDLNFGFRLALVPIQ